MADRTVAIHYVATGVARAAAAPNIVADAHVRAFNKINAAAMTKMQSTSRAVASVAAVAGKAILFGVGAALAVGAKAAIDFESSMAGVFKTLGDTATTSEIVALGEALREMSLDIPVNVNELAFIAELGGQLGVGIDDMEHFTRTIAALATTTNLSSADAAKGLARFSNIMQLPISDVDDLGNIIVDLGNNFATTESEILNFGLRLAPIGKTVGATKDEILGIAAAFSSLGIPAERGGTAVQRTFIEIEKAVDAGGRELEQFASIAGMTADEFSRLSAVGRFQAFIEGLGDIGEAGDSVFQALERVNISQQRSIQVLLAAAGAGDLFSSALDRGSAALDDSNALWEEAARRWGTSASQIKLLVNTFNDLRIEIGQGLIPIINSAIGLFRDFLTALRNNMDVLKLFAGVLITLVVGKAIVGLVGAAGKAINAIRGLSASFLVAKAASGGLVATAGAATVALGALTLGIGLAVAAFTAFIFWQARSEGKTRALREAAKDLNDELDRGVPAFDAWSEFLKSELGGANSDIARDHLVALGIGTDELTTALTDVDGSSLEDLREKVIRLSDAQIQARKDLAEGGGGGRVGVGADINKMNEGRAAALELLIGLEQQLAVVAEESERRKSEAGLNTDKEAERRMQRFLEANDVFDARATFGSPLDQFLLSSDDNLKAYEKYTETVDDLMGDLLETVAEHFEEVRDEVFSSIDIWGDFDDKLKIDINKVIGTLKTQAGVITKWNATLATLLAMGVSGAVIQTFDSFDLATKNALNKLLDKDPAEFLRFVEGFEGSFAEIDAAAVAKAELFDPLQAEMNLFVSGMLAEANQLSDGAAGFEAFKISALEQLDQLGPDGRAALITSLDMLVDSGVLQDMFGVGTSLIQGLIDGMNAKRADLGQAIRNLAGDVIGWAGDSFEVKSPSKVFMRMGHQIAAGLNKGMADGMNVDLRALDNHIGSFRQAAFGPSSNQTSNTSSVTNQYDLQVSGSTNPQGDASSILLTAQLAGTIL